MKNKSEELLKRYSKNREKEKIETHVTSVNVWEYQREFLQKRNLNLSEVTRDAIDDLIESIEGKEAVAKYQKGKPK